MLVPLDPMQMNLLSQLSEILQNPDTPTLLQWLSSPTHSQTPSPPLELPILPEQTLLQRMNETRSLEDLNQLLKPSEVATLLKWAQSPLSAGYSGKTLLSQLHSPKRRQLSIPTSPRYSPSNQPLINQMELTTQEQSTYNTQPILERLASRETLKKHETAQNQNQMMKMTNLPRSRNFSRVTCLGSWNPTTLPLPTVTPVAKRLVDYSEPTIKTFPTPNSLSKSLQTLPPVFLLPNGNKSLRETLLTLTNLLIITPYCPWWRENRPLGRLRNHIWSSWKWKNELPLHWNGLLHGGKPQKQLVFPSPIKEFLGTTLNANFQPSLSCCTINSSSTTLHSRMMLLEANILNSQTITDSWDSIQPLYFQMGSKLPLNNQLSKNQVHTKAAANPKSATSSILECVKIQMLIASINTSVRTKEEFIALFNSHVLEIHGIQGFRRAWRAG